VVDKIPSSFLYRPTEYKSHWIWQDVAPVKVLPGVKFSNFDPCRSEKFVPDHKPSSHGISTEMSLFHFEILRPRQRSSGTSSPAPNPMVTALRTNFSPTRYPVQHINYGDGILESRYLLSPADTTLPSNPMNHFLPTPRKNNRSTRS
jgi:hypothetical protein